MLSREEVFTRSWRHHTNLIYAHGDSADERRASSPSTYRTYATSRVCVLLVQNPQLRLVKEPQLLEVCAFLSDNTRAHDNLIRAPTNFYPVWHQQSWLVMHDLLSFDHLGLDPAF